MLISIHKMLAGNY